LIAHIEKCLIKLRGMLQPEVLFTTQIPDELEMNGNHRSNRGVGTPATVEVRVVIETVAPWRAEATAWFALLLPAARWQLSAVRVSPSAGKCFTGVNKIHVQATHDDIK
jgi:hypothetical protein